MRWPWYYAALTVLAIGLSGSLVVSAANHEEGKPRVKAHLTLYVGGELLQDGGTVIVSAIPVPEAELRAMTGPNPAIGDLDNAKRSQLNEQDILLGAKVTGRANYVEVHYPEDGAFGFNLVSDKDLKSLKNLKTERILIGSSRWPDPQSPDKWIEADVSTIFVAGGKASQSESRLVRTIESRVDAFGPRRIEYQGVRVKIPTNAQLSEASSGEIK